MDSGRDSIARRQRRGFGLPLIAALVLALLIPAASLAAFGGGTPYENPRVNSPNDPEFDRCEADDEDGTKDCDSYAQEEFRAFGFSPDSANEVPPGVLPHYATGTKYKDCVNPALPGRPQIDPQGEDANVKAEGVAGDPVGKAAARCLQIAGVRADSAWKFSTGDPDVAVAILDTGIRWQSTELVNKVRLNKGELPRPLHGRAAPLAGTKACATFGTGYDATGDGAVNIRDYACDERVEQAAGDQESDSILDASDLIATFSDSAFDGGDFAGGVDDDDNGYVDDIAGWDFFDDDNDPFDASSCCSANGHGTGRATEAVGETNNGLPPDPDAGAGVGMCPDCQLIPLRVWDTFVVPTDNYAMAAVYAADNGASVVEGAVGGLTNTQFARSAFTYADSKGVALTLVSSDINSANHNYPTNYNEAIYVGGSLYDTAPNDTCSGPGGLPGLPDFPDTPGGFDEGCQQFLGFLSMGGVSAGEIGQPTTTSFFRNSNLTQYGGKADIVLMGSTGSENTGQASGAAGLLASFGREQLGDDDPLSGNEIRQLLTMTAEDVQPENTGTIGLPGQGQRGLGSALRLRPGQPRRSDGADRQPPGAGAGAGDGAHRSLRVALRRRSRNVRPAGGADRHARLVHADRRGSGPRRGDQGRGPRRGTALSARRGGLGARVRLRPGRARRRLRTDPGHAGRGHRRGRPRIPREPAEGDAREPRHDMRRPGEHRCRAPGGRSR